MTKNVEELPYPIKASKEITFIFYNYNNIDKLIEDRRNTIIEKMNGSTAAWLKALKQDSNSFEDIIVRLDEDSVINRLKHWKTFLLSFFNILKNYKETIYYELIELKYFKYLENEEIMKNY